MADDKKTYITKMTVDHNKQRYTPGSEIELTDYEAKSVAGAVSLKAEQPAAPDEKVPAAPADTTGDEGAEASRQALAEARATELDISTVDQLKELAAEAKIDLGDAKLKADIIAAIVAAETSKEGNE